MPLLYTQLPSAPQTFRRKKAKRFQAKMMYVVQLKTGPLRENPGPGAEIHFGHPTSLCVFKKKKDLDITNTVTSPKFFRVSLKKRSSPCDGAYKAKLYRTAFKITGRILFYCKKAVSSQQENSVHCNVKKFFESGAPQR